MTVRLAPAPPRVTAPVPRLRLLLPVKVKSPFQFWTLLLARFATELSSVAVLFVFGAMTSVPVPRAVVLPSVRVPLYR